MVAPRYKRLLLSSLAVVLLQAVPQARSETLQEALVEAYARNPSLAASRARLRATDELVPQARSGYRPTVEAYGNAGRSWMDAGEAGRGTSNPAGVEIAIEQPLYNGGGTIAANSQAENLVLAERAALLSTEQSVLLEAVEAYMSVLTDTAILNLNINNQTVIERQLDASRDRFKVGEITRTDVSQAEYRLQRAIADRIQAEGQLNTSKAFYARSIGSLPRDLTAPVLNYSLPQSVSEAVDTAKDNNPEIVSASKSEAAARDSIDQARAEMRPSLSLRASAGKSWRQGVYGQQDSDEVSVTAQLRIPLYQAGAASSRVREAKETASQRRTEIEGTQRSVTEQAVQAWELLTTARASIRSRNAQIQAAEVALQGLQQEALVGSRTTLDVLDGEQEMLDARVGLVQSQRDEIVATFTLLKALGRLTAQQIDLPVDLYDPARHYEAVKGKWWGTSTPE